MKGFPFLDRFVNDAEIERFVPLSWRPGDEIVLRVPGGGGFGDPEERERERVLEDIALGFVSTEAARDIYGVDTPLDAEQLKLEAIRRAVIR